MFRHLFYMSGLGGCNLDCSGRGECHNGTCLCEIRYAGELCDGPNVPYHAGVGGVFFLIALVCAIQLIMCIVCEYQRLKAPTFLRACKVTNQKLVYFIICLASLIRGAYFISPDSFRYEWSSSLLSSYYPLLMSSASLIVCFWAEVFHLHNVRWDKTQFLSKSFLGFITFNIINYSLLVAEFLTTSLAKPPADDPGFYTHFFNGCYAVLLFIVVIFFLIYGVEVYFKVRGGFVTKPLTLSYGVAGTSRTGGGGGAEAEPLREERLLQPRINSSQLHQSRIGLLSQAFMLIIIVGFLFSETLSQFWKTKVPINSRNWHDVLFRAVEIGVAVWFPAVLWNCMQPAELWILNPQKLLTKLDHRLPSDGVRSPRNGLASPSGGCGVGDDVDAGIGGEEGEDGEACLERRECWICYDGEKTEPLIQPCACTGDVSSVHHECLRRWLVESAAAAPSGAQGGPGTATALSCKVCGCAYDVCSTSRLDWERGFTYRHWGGTAVTVTLLCVTVAGAWIVIQLFDQPYVRMISASIALIVIYVCIKFLGHNTLSAYQRAKVAALSISNHVTTISEGVKVDAETNGAPHTSL